ncbi:hypothetical protein B0H13DRAFT_2431768, partial [Mycena leptocephala]
MADQVNRHLHTAFRDHGDRGFAYMRTHTLYARTIPHASSTLITRIPGSPAFVPAKLQERFLLQKKSPQNSFPQNCGKNFSCQEKYPLRKCLPAILWEGFLFQRNCPPKFLCPLLLRLALPPSALLHARISTPPRRRTRLPHRTTTSVLSPQRTSCVLICRPVSVCTSASAPRPSTLQSWLLPAPRVTSSTLSSRAIASPAP